MTLKLHDTTLVAATTTDYRNTIRAIKKSLVECEFDDVILFSDKKFIDKDYRTVIINRFKDVNDYSRFILKDLSAHISTKFVVIIQWDGYITNAKLWNNVNFTYDYIGAIWPHHDNSVGNGGFSFRSKKLLESTSDSSYNISYPEDVSICIHNRRFLEDKFSIKFAPNYIANQFSYERSDCNQTFGFHGSFNLPLHNTIIECIKIIANTGSRLLFNKDTREILYALIKKTYGQ